MDVGLENALQFVIDRIASEVSDAVLRKLCRASETQLTHASKAQAKPEATGVPKLLSESEVEKEYGLTRAWLRSKRFSREGPPFLKIGKMVRYRREDIESFLSDGLIQPRHRKPVGP